MQRVNIIGVLKDLMTSNYKFIFDDNRYVASPSGGYHSEGLDRTLSVDSSLTGEEEGHEEHEDDDYTPLDPTYLPPGLAEDDESGKEQELKDDEQKEDDDGKEIIVEVGMKRKKTLV